MSSYHLTFDEPLETWLNSNSEAEDRAAHVLELHGVKILNRSGGAGVGQWTNGKHETTFEVEADEPTAHEMAILIQAEIGYLVEVVKSLADE